jgi:hypothetical protein
MAPPEISSLSSLSAPGIIPGPNLYLSKNVTINSTAASGIQTTLPLTTSSVVSAKELNINSDGTNSALTINSSGDIKTSGDLSVGPGKFTVSHVDGTATSDISYNSYVLPASSTNTSTTLASGDEPLTTSATSKYLSTQEYVDTQIWNQTKRINTILGTDPAVVDSFNNVYKLVTAFAGVSDTVDTLNDISGKYATLVDRAEEINTSVSTIVSQAYNQINVNCTPTVWQDECGPLPIPATITSKTTEDGWYFSNFLTSEKINWYMPTNGTSMTVGDIQNLYMNIFAQSDVSLPFITIYTVAKTDGTNYANWANAKINYVFNSDATSSTANKSYCLYTGSNPMNVYNKTSIKSVVYTENVTNKNNANPGSSFDNTIVAATDKILAIAVSTDSGANVGNINFVINSLNVCLKTGTTSFAFSNSGVATNYLFNYLFKKHPDFSAYPLLTGNTIKEKAHSDAYDTAFTM